jgi:hypothetical protein
MVVVTTIAIMVDIAVEDIKMQNGCWKLTVHGNLCTASQLLSVQYENGKGFQ